MRHEAASGLQVRTWGLRNSYLQQKVRAACYPKARLSLPVAMLGTYPYSQAVREEGTPPKVVTSITAFRRERA
jgi:hypothetical protein